MQDESRALALADTYMPRGLDRSHLGLFIANKIAKAHGGRLELESELGQGTRIAVHLPRKHEAPEDDGRDEPLAVEDFE